MTSTEPRPSYCVISLVVITVGLTGFSLFQFVQILTLKHDVADLKTRVEVFETINSLSSTNQEPEVKVRNRRQVPLAGFDTQTYQIIAQGVFNQGCKNDSKYCMQGPKGDLGAKGMKGGNGTDGIDGSPGQKGEPGVSVKGDKGDIGIGLPGSQGGKGEPGRQGDPGVPGTKGNKGELGPKGFDGPFGPPGLKGEPGVNGTKGDKGDMGLAGIKGEPGSKGEGGTFGPQGPAGSKGDSGSIGLPGQKGEQGLAGIKGTTGDSGPFGPQGPKGENGAMGPAGMTGSSGPKGEQGLTGLTGQKGDIGPKGDMGPVGTTGSHGMKGEQGSPGLQGPNGLPGAKGEPGTSANSCCNLLASPQFQGGNSDYNIQAKEGNTILLPCKVSGYPTPVVTWSKNNSPVQNSRMLQTLNGLVFVNITEAESGTYVCKAESALGVTTKTIIVKVTGDHPHVSAKEPVIYVGQGQSVRTGCIVTNANTSKIIYTKVGGVLPLHNIMYDGDLQFFLRDSGSTGEYQCEAITEKGVVSASFHVIQTLGNMTCTTSFADCTNVDKALCSGECPSGCQDLNEQYHAHRFALNLPVCRAAVNSGTIQKSAGGHVVWTNEHANGGEAAEFVSLATKS